MKTDRKKLSDKLDKLVSLKIRELGRCERCGATDRILQCCHIYSRANKWLRWDFENLICMCRGCHFGFWHREPAKAIRWAETIRDFSYLDKVMRKNQPMKIADMGKIYEDLYERLKTPDSLLGTKKSTRTQTKNEPFDD